MDPLEDFLFAETAEGLSSRFWSREVKPVAQRIYKGAKILAKTRAAYDAYKDVKSAARRGASSLSSAQRNMVYSAKRFRSGMRKGMADFGQLERKALGLRTGSRGRSGPMPRSGPFTASKQFGRSRKKSTKFRKAKKPKKLGSALTTKRHYDDYGTIARDHCLWAGFADHGSYHRMFDIAGEAVTKVILGKMKVYPKLYDQPLAALVDASGSGVTLTLNFKRIRHGGNDELLALSVTDIGAKSFKTLASAVATHMQGASEGASGVAASADTVAYYLDSVKVFDVGTGLIVHSIQDMAQAILSINVVCKTKLQNVTVNSANNSFLDVTGLNPLVGKKYIIGDSRCRLVSEIQEHNALYDEFAESPQSRPVTGVSVINQLGVDDPLGHPPAAKAVFTNCRGVANIRMAAGAANHDVSKFSMRVSMRDFIERLYYSGMEKGTWGRQTWYCLERVFRQNGNDSISIGFNREVSMSASCTLKKAIPMLRHYDNTDAGAL
jgi:hypothetical protein